MLYYGSNNGSILGAHFTFNLQLLGKVDGNSTAKDLIDAIIEWIDYMPLEHTANWIVS